MSSATDAISGERTPVTFPFFIVALVVATAVLAFAAWRWSESQTRGAISVPVLELGTRGDSMVFDQTELKARTGTMVKVVFRNNSRLGAMAHNWVLVQPGTEQMVATAGQAAGPENNYLRPNDANVIAFTKLSAPGENSTVTFTAPPPGIYPYFCAFPGHQMVMKGTLVVTP